jgi:hypothetical protein
MLSFRGFSPGIGLSFLVGSCLFMVGISRLSRRLSPGICAY